MIWQLQKNYQRKQEKLKKEKQKKQIDKAKNTLKLTEAEEQSLRISPQLSVRNLMSFEGADKKSEISVIKNVRILESPSRRQDGEPKTEIKVIEKIQRNSAIAATKKPIKLGKLINAGNDC